MGARGPQGRLRRGLGRGRGRRVATAEGFKKAPIELNETFEEIWAKGVDPDDYKSPYLYNPEDPHNKLKKEQQDALDAVKSNYDRNKPVPLRIG